LTNIISWNSGERWFMGIYNFRGNVVMFDILIRAHIL